MKPYHLGDKHVEFNDGRRYILMGEVVSYQERDGFLSIVQTSKYDGLYQNDMYALTRAEKQNSARPILHTLTRRDGFVYPADAFCRALLLPSGRVRSWIETVSQVIQVDDDLFVVMQSGDTQEVRRKSICGMTRTGCDVWIIHQDRYDPQYPLGAEYSSMELRSDGDIEAYRSQGGSDVVNAHTGLVDMSYLNYMPNV